jgi:uncharacterized protein (TIGR04222 family)
VNPFDLPGPEFLVFYWVLLIAGLGTLWWRRWRTDVGGTPERMCGDPYQLAFLRDGHPEVVRVALLALVEERTLAVKMREFSLRPTGQAKRRPPEGPRPAIEQELLSFLANESSTVDEIIDAEVGSEACTAYREQLEQLGFLRGPAPLARVRRAGNAVAAVLLGVATIKLGVALARGRYNVAFLILSAATGVWAALRLRSELPPRTTRGQEALDAAGALLAGAHQRLKDAGAAVRGRELAWIAAAFGFSVFNYTEVDFSFWPALAYTAPKEIRAALSSSGMGFGSSCSSCGSGGSSCGGGGGGCGGGGGGGGCGGCGGHG